MSEVVTIPDPDFEPGDSVKIKGTQGQFSFIRRRQNTASGEEWRDLFGGLSTRPGTWRSVRPELVLAAKRSKATSRRVAKRPAKKKTRTGKKLV